MSVVRRVVAETQPRWCGHAALARMAVRDLVGSHEIHGCVAMATEARAWTACCQVAGCCMNNQRDVFSAYIYASCSVCRMCWYDNQLRMVR